MQPLLLIRKQAERVTVGVEHDTHLLLGLVISQSGSYVEGPLHCGGEASNAEVEMDHHQLLAVLCRPFWSGVVRFPLHLDLLRAVR